MNIETLASPMTAAARSLSQLVTRWGRVGLAVVALGTPLLASAGSAMPLDYKDYVDSSKAVDSVEQAAHAPGLASFLDPRGHLMLPPGFSMQLAVTCFC